MSSDTKTVVRGYKVTDPAMKCRSKQYELNKEYEHKGEVKHCASGFHFCLNAAHCFNYYTFSKENRVFEVEAWGEVLTEGDKSVCSHIKFIRELTWLEVLTVVNTGADNTGFGNSGDRNSGDRNSGYRNSGNWNSGNWNSGDRNSGDSNSGYRNSGAFCTDPNPKLILFDLPTNITVRDWENHKAVRIMEAIDPTIWVPAGAMTDKEKKDNPKWETTEGYLKTISMKDAWKNAWHNWDDDTKNIFLTLPNFDAAKFEEITGIKVKNGKGAKSK